MTRRELQKQLDALRSELEQQRAALRGVVEQDLAAARSAKTAEKRWGLLRDAKWLPEVPLWVVLGGYEQHLDTVRNVLTCCLPLGDKVLGNVLGLDRTARWLSDIVLDRPGLSRWEEWVNLPLEWEQEVVAQLRRVEDDAYAAWRRGMEMALLDYREGALPVPMSYGYRLTCLACRSVATTCRAALMACRSGVPGWETRAEALRLAARREGCRASYCHQELCEAVQQAGEVRNWRPNRRLPWDQHLWNYTVQCCTNPDRGLDDFCDRIRVWLSTV